MEELQCALGFNQSLDNINLYSVENKEELAFESAATEKQVQEGGFELVNQLALSLLKIFMKDISDPEKAKPSVGEAVSN